MGAYTTASDLDATWLVGVWLSLRNTIWISCETLLLQSEMSRTVSLLDAKPLPL